MKLKYLERIFFPFQTKRFGRLTWISIVLIGLLLPVVAADDVKQVDIKEARELVKQAEKLTRKGNLLDAEKILREVLEKDSSNVKAKLVLSYVLLKQRKLIDSYELAFEIAKNDAKNARAFALVGMNLLNLGNFREAGILLRTSNRLDQEEAVAWFGFGLLDFYENRIEEGLDKLRTAEFLDPHEPDFVFALAQVYARAEKYKEAADAYNRFLSISPPSDADRRNRIKGLINFLRYLGHKQQLYLVDGGPKQSTVPLQIMRDRPIIEVGVNGKEEKLRFVLDTGSGISVISDETAQRLKIKPVSKGGLARAVGGDGKFEIVYGFLKSVEVGEMRVRNVPVYIRKFHDDGEKIDGYIGLSLISKFLTTVDYGTASFTLTKKNKETVRDFEKEEIALPLRLTSSGFLSGEVQLPGIEAPLNFIVDTGASISVISEDLARTDEIKGFSTAERMRVIGAAGVTENVPSFLIPKVSFGSHSRESIKAIALDLDIINEASGFEQAGILGGNFLKNYRLTFDFQNSKVTFVPVKKK
jgi:predicted aspartyl protease/thioredoxin-like negative regulator of GroEL